MKIKKMVTYFNRKDLVSFGSYLMSEKRKARFDEAYEEAIRNGIDNPLYRNSRYSKCLLTDECLCVVAV